MSTRLPVLAIPLLTVSIALAAMPTSAIAGPPPANSAQGRSARKLPAAVSDAQHAKDAQPSGGATSESPAGAARPDTLAPRALPTQTPGMAPQRPRDRSWVETSRGDSIITFKREVRGSEIIALRGEGTVNASVQRVASVLLDYARSPEWIDSLEEVRVVRMLGPLEFIEYDHVGTPPIIMKDRDFVCRGKLYVDTGEQSLVMTIEPTTDPLLPPTSYIRGTLAGYWKLKAIDHGRKTLVITEMHSDPKGAVAHWLVNLFQKSWARNTIESLRAQVAKPDIKVMPQVAAAFEGRAFSPPITTR